MRYQFFLNFFHLVKSVGPYEWENTQEQTFFGLLTKSTALYGAPVVSDDLKDIEL